MKTIVAHGWQKTFANTWRVGSPAGSRSNG
jgi:hypothetical protein